MESALRADLTAWLAKWNAIRGLPPTLGLPAILGRVDRELAERADAARAGREPKSAHAYGEGPLSPS